MTNPVSEQAFLAQYNIHDFDVPLTTVDMAIFTLREKRLEVLLVKRAQHPAQGKWALPGGFIQLGQDHSLEDAAHRKLLEKTGVASPYLEQVMTVGNAKRDPRGWSVTVVYFALIASDSLKIQPDESSEQVAWVPVKEALENYDLAFDHQTLLATCHARLKSKVLYTALPVHLLPDAFTLTDLQQVFEILLDQPVEKKAFRRRILDAGILEETGGMRTGQSRPAKLYRVSDKQQAHCFPRNIEGPR